MLGLKIPGQKEEGSSSMRTRRQMTLWEMIKTTGTGCTTSSVGCKVSGTINPTHVPVDRDHLDLWRVRCTQDWWFLWNVAWSEIVIPQSLYILHTLKEGIHIFLSLSLSLSYLHSFLDWVIYSNQRKQHVISKMFLGLNLPPMVFYTPSPDSLRIHTSHSMSPDCKISPPLKTQVNTQFPQVSAYVFLPVRRLYVCVSFVFFSFSFGTGILFKFNF